MNKSDPILTVDGVIFQFVDTKLSVLLIQRGYEPFKGQWALPGVYIEPGETSKQALERVLAQKADLSLSKITLIEQPFAFDAPHRDPRAYAVTVMYMGLCKNAQPGSAGDGSNLQNPQFTTLSELPELAYDHRAIVAFAHNRLAALATHTNVVGMLLPKTFTLTQLQQAYEAIFEKKFDKRNFRKRMLMLGFVKETGDMYTDGAHRPAKLYTLAKNKFQSYTPAFE
jgi:8-oxo-dGTP diphosphatase